MDVPFDPAKWIRAQKIYKDVPLEVSDAYAAAREMPPNLQAILLSPALSVTEFLSLFFPRTLNTKHRKSNQTDPWFSTDLPNCDNIISTLWTSKSLPSHRGVRGRAPGALGGGGEWHFLELGPKIE